MIYEYRTSLKGKVLIMTKNITFLESHEALQAKKMLKLIRFSESEIWTI